MAKTNKPDTEDSEHVEEHSETETPEEGKKKKTKKNEAKELVTTAVAKRTLEAGLAKYGVKMRISAASVDIFRQLMECLTEDYLIQAVGVMSVSKVRTLNHNHIQFAQHLRNSVRQQTHGGSAGVIKKKKRAKSGKKTVKKAEEKVSSEE